VPSRRKARANKQKTNKQKKQATDSSLVCNSGLLFLTSFPVVHLASLERVVVGARGTVGVDGTAVIRAEHDEKVVPHAWW
jgi:hypothetical protein